MALCNESHLCKNTVLCSVRHPECAYVSDARFRHNSADKKEQLPVAREPYILNGKFSLNHRYTECRQNEDIENS